MGLGNLGWNNLQLGINGGVNNPTLFRSEEDEEAKLMQSLPNGNRITNDGYMTNAPLELGMMILFMQLVMMVVLGK